MNTVLIVDGLIATNRQAERHPAAGFVRRKQILPDPRHRPAHQEPKREPQLALKTQQSLRGAMLAHASPRPSSMA